MKPNRIPPAAVVRLRGQQAVAAIALIKSLGGSFTAQPEGRQ